MRSLAREKRTVFVSQPLPPEPIKDADGNDTGAVASIYDEPVELRLNLKPITDQLERQSFGTDVNSILKAEYTLFDVEGLDIVENSAVWIGVLPNGILRDDGVTPMNHNYTVEQVIGTGGQVKVYFKKKAGAAKA